MAGFTFYSGTYEWLAVAGKTKAQFKGSGTINDELDPNRNAFKSMIWAGGGAPDTFPIKIWWEASGTEVVVYDNGVEQAIGGGMHNNQSCPLLPVGNSSHTPVTSVRTESSPFRTLPLSALAS